MTVFTFLTLIVIVVLVAIILFFRFYRRATKEIAFIRTGFGGEKVVIGGGAIVVPILQEVTEVNLNILRLSVGMTNNEAVISKDRMRVNVMVDFYVHIPPTEESVSTAAATLGSRTLRPDAVRDIVEGKFVDAIRAIAAEMTMEELHAERKRFALKILGLLNEALSRNGLALESVSITSLDQTNMDYFNPSNAFDAEGLTRLTETIEQRKKKRNDIEQDAKIQIKHKNLETEKLYMALEREEQFARLEQQLSIENQKSEQTSQIAKQRALQSQSADEADIEKQKKIEIAKILSSRMVEEERLNRERIINEREIEKDKAIKLAEQIRDQEISKGALSQMKSKEEAEKMRAVLVSTEERVLTEREKETAERRKTVAIIEAAREAETDNIKAKADAIRYKTDAEGQRDLNDARNLLSADQISSEMRKYLIDHLPEIIRESGEPLKNIESIRIVQTGGLGGTGNTSNDGGNGRSLFEDALRYRAQASIVDALLKELGLSSSGIIVQETDTKNKGTPD